jgi:hypothetical protein
MERLVELCCGCWPWFCGERGRWSRLCGCMIGAGAVWLLVAAAAYAERPRVAFDMPFTVACQDVTPPAYASANPAHRLVEARLEISSLLVAGEERDLVQYFIRIDSPERSLTVIDYLPKTLHESPLAGPMSFQNTTERSASLGINLSGKYEPLAATGSAGIGQKNTSCVKFDLLPPLESVAASGTLARGSAVFFKLKASPRHLLEGSRQYALVLRVPAAWRVEMLRVACEAEAIQRGVVSSLDERFVCGRREFSVALYQEGDEPARQIAEQIARRPLAPRPAKSEPRSAKQPAVWPLGTAAWELLKR